MTAYPLDLILPPATTARVGQVDLILGGETEPPPEPITLGDSLQVSWGLPWMAWLHRDTAAALAWSATKRVDRAAATAWVAPGRVDLSAALPWSALFGRSRERLIRWTGGAVRDRAAALDWSAVYRRDRTVTLPWAALAGVGRGFTAPWSAPVSVTDGWTLAWPSARSITRSMQVPWNAPVVAVGRWRIVWGVRPPRLLCRPVYAVGQVDLALALISSAGAVGQADLVLPLSALVCREIEGGGPITPPIGPYPKPPPRLIVPVRRIYTVLHEVSLIRADNGADLPVESLSLTTDSDSWCWQMRAALVGPDAAEQVQPGSDGPVLVVASVNGLDWEFLVESWEEDRSFGRTSVSIAGRSPSAALSADYTLPRDYTETNLRTAQQLAAQELPAGWEISAWTLPDWAVPVGAWSYQGQAPIGAIGQVVAAAGGVLRSARTGQALVVQPRYPVAPWDYADATPDVSLPQAIARAQRRAYSPPGGANAVYVHGESPGGVLARVRLGGTAGDDLVPTVVDRLITHADAARSRGIRELAARYQQPDVRTLQTWLGGDMPLLEIGSLVLYGGAVRGLVSSIQIDASRSGGTLTVAQSIGLGESTGNVWRRFSALLPAQPLLVGTVAMAHGDGTATVALVGGGSVRVRNPVEAGAGTAVWVRGGVVEGPAPALAAVDLEV